MKANQQSLRKEGMGTPQEEWHIDAVGNCGAMWFDSVVVVYEPLSVNPGLKTKGTTGLRGLKKSIRLIEAERKRLGLTTLK